jgi:ethanolamine utilization protein EutN
MQIGTVVGHATATVKHPSMSGWRLLLVQLVGVGDQPDGEPILVIDHLGAGVGSRVLVTNDGLAVREAVKSKNTPLRWMTLGLCDG